MRWKTPEKLKHGEVRCVRYFALIPVELSDGHTVWLERYWAKEEWQYLSHDPIASYWKIVWTGVTHPNRPNTGSTSVGHLSKSKYIPTSGDF